MINLNRVKAVADTLRSIPVEALDAVEENDPQYKAVKHIVEIYGFKSIALVVANALVSYRLTSTGEEYWLEYANWLLSNRPLISKGIDVVNTIARFLESSQGNRILVSQKINRINKVASIIEELLANPRSFTDLSKLVKLLSARFTSHTPEKTIIFAAKMAYYAYKALGIHSDVESVDVIPIDKRVALVSSTSLIVEASPEHILRKQRLKVLALEAWRQVSRLSNIPLLRLDSVIWLPARGVDSVLRRGRLEAARDDYAKRLVEYSSGLIPWGLAYKIASQILYRNPYIREPLRRE